MAELEKLLEVWRITQRKGGAVYKTEYLEDRWVPIDTQGRPDGDPDLMFVVKSSDYPGLTHRRKPSSTT